MKRQSIVLLLFFSIVNASCAQNIDSSLFVKLASKAIVEMEYAFMQDIKSNSPIKEIEQNGLNSFKEFFLEQENESVRLSVVKNFLENKENGWSVTGFRVFNKLYENYLFQISKREYNLEKVLDIDKGILNINGSIKFWESQKIIQLIKFKNTIVSQKSSQIGSVQSSEDKGITALFELKTAHLVIFILIIAIFFIIGFVSGIFYERIHQKNNKKESAIYQNSSFGAFQKDSLERNSKNKDKEKVKQSSSDSTSADKNDNERFKNKTNAPVNTEQKNIVGEPKVITAEPKNVSLVPKAAEQTKEEPVVPVKPVIETFYFTIPDKKGFFDDSFKSHENDPKRLYQLTIENDSVVGDIVFQTGKNDKMAIRLKEDILKPVCTLKNESLEDPIGIRMETPGRVTCQNGKWVIDKPIKISFY